MISLAAMTTYHTDKFSAHQYQRMYDPLFAPLREGTIRLLELGINTGESLRLWRDYFATGSTIVGLDRVVLRKDLRGVVQVQGDQADEALLDSVGRDYGPFNVIIDDASHKGILTAASFRGLAKWLAKGGLYIVEDLNSEVGEGHIGRFTTTAFELALDLAHGKPSPWESITVAEQMLVFRATGTWQPQASHASVPQSPPVEKSGLHG